MELFKKKSLVVKVVIKIKIFPEIRNSCKIKSSNGHNHREERREKREWLWLGLALPPNYC